ncbi:MAG: deoxyhypusine synthase [Candidatus Altiarchaeota archaeon]|nr:deoxyhypusine synthase [Candidatus Altiarchaeota archaeon]
MARFSGIPVRDIKLQKGVTASELVEGMKAGGGFTAKKLAVGVDILAEMLDDEESLNFLSFPAALVSTGVRGVFAELAKRKLFDVFITTCGTLDHDLARVHKNYYHGDFMMDDALLHRKGVNRLGNIVIPNECYGIVLEDKMRPVLEELYHKGMRETSGYELIWEFGKRLKDKDSILYWAAKNEIPIIVPGILDGAFGSQLYFFQQAHRDFRLNLFKDEDVLAEKVFSAKKTGALMIGGGISKHHTIWWNQFMGGLSRAVYLTTAVEHDGSLSGARIREAVSWGKVKEKAKYITVEGDASINLPLMMAAVLDRIG